MLSNPVVGGDFTPQNKTHQTFPKILDDDKINGLSLPLGKWKDFTIPTLSDNNSFTLSFWIFIENQYDGQQVKTTLLNRGDSFKVSYRSFNNQLLISVNTLLEPMIRGSNNVQECIVDNKIILQKWNQVLISMKNRTLDVYINGKLSNSFVLLNVPNLPSNSNWSLLNDPNTFYGMLSSIRYFNYSFDQHTALKFYQFSKYKGYPSTSRFWFFWRNPGSIEKLIFY
jgi:hypothetical protein